MISDFEHLFTCLLAIFMSLEKYLLKPFAIFEFFVVIVVDEL